MFGFVPKFRLKTVRPTLDIISVHCLMPAAWFIDYNVREYE
jgi:hypothetical protein